MSVAGHLILRPRRAGLTAAVACLVILAAPLLEAGAITFSTALPITRGHGVFRLQLKGLRATGDPGPRDRELNAAAMGVIIAYGVTEKLTLFGAIPVRRTRLELDLPGGRGERSASGVGDLRLLARYTVIQRDEPGSTLRLAPFVGVEAPTGASDRSDRFGPLPPPMQPGSGSWDAIGGVALTRQTLAWEADVALSYTLAGAGDRFQLGDTARLDLSYQRRVAPRELGAGVPAFFYVVLESNLVWRGRTTVGGVEDPASGGTTWFLAPGLQYVTRTFVLEGVVQLPVVQNLGPDGLETDLIVTLGIRIYL